MKGSGSGRGRRDTSERRKSSRATEEETVSTEETDTGDAGQTNWDIAH